MGKNKKDITVYFYLIKKVVGIQEADVTTPELQHLIDCIKKLPIELESNPTRFLNISNSEKCVIFNSDETKTVPKIKSIAKGCVYGVYFKRRDKNYPYENDGTSNLFEIKLSSEENELAEVTYFIMDVENKILSFITNRFVGSINDFTEYLNSMYKKACESFSMPEQDIRLSFPLILNENAEGDFDKMTNLTQLSLSVGGNIKAMEEFVSPGNKSSDKTIAELIRFTKESNAMTLKLIFGVGRTKENINKKSIKELYNTLKSFFKNNSKQNSFMVTGSIDEESRVLDLLKDEYFHKTTFSYSTRYMPLDMVFKNLYEIHNKYIEIFKKESII